MILQSHLVKKFFETTQKLYVIFLSANTEIEKGKKNVLQLTLKPSSTIR